MRLRFTCLVLLLASQCMLAQGIEFFDGGWVEALEKSKAEEKPIFVDAYASWCGPCKRMAATTFKEKEVGEFFNSNFINVKFDMEKSRAKDFKSKFSVSSYPTLFFIDEDGEVLHKTVGGKDVEKLIKAAKMALRNNDQSDKYVEEYEKGNRDFDLVLNYIKALNKVEKPSLKISNDFINSKPEITPEQRAEFVYEATVESDSRLFKMLTQEKNTVIKVKSEQEYYDKVVAACYKTVDKAIKYESPSLVEEAQEHMKKHYKDESKKFEVQSEMIYSKGMRDMKGYIEATEKYSKKFISKNPEELHDLSQDIAKELQRYPEAMHLSEEIAKKAVEKGKESKYLMNYSQILLMNDKKSEALKQAEKAKSLIEEEGKSINQINSLIKYIESK